MRATTQARTRTGVRFFRPSGHTFWLHRGGLEWSAWVTTFSAFTGFTSGRRSLGRVQGTLPSFRCRANSAGAWILLVMACYLLGEIGEIVGVPAPQLVVPLLVGAALALGGMVRRNLPAPALRGSQAVLGVLMGSYLNISQLRSVLGTALPLTVVTLATIALCLLAALLFSRTSRGSFTDAALGMMPGGSAAIVACAEELRADSRLVALSQYLRVGLVALTAPAVVAVSHGTVGRPHPGSFPAFAHLVDGSSQLLGLAFLAGVCLLGARAGRRLALPAPALLGPMLLGMVVGSIAVGPGFAPAGPLRDLVFILVGLDVGLRFSRDSVREIRRVLPSLCGCIALVCLGSAGLAWVLARMIGIPFLESYLATTPGGINAVLATATVAHINVGVVSTVQSFRLVLVVLLTPPLVRWLVRRTTPVTVAPASVPVPVPEHGPGGGDPQVVERVGLPAGPLEQHVESVLVEPVVAVGDGTQRAPGGRLARDPDSQRLELDHRAQRGAAHDPTVGLQSARRLGDPAGGDLVLPLGNAEGAHELEQRVAVLGDLRGNPCQRVTEGCSAVGRRRTASEPQPGGGAGEVVVQVDADRTRAGLRPDHPTAGDGLGSDVTHATPPSLGLTATARTHRHGSVLR
ncbi:AbrB family transcriptional regulator [Frankia sp. ACN1ag]|uniref:AbrB family transcriptional regulator n=1 Tax=Frankia sp. ACN1ag TaxID=102891 RepID=UPI0028C403B7|nr:AbrB family transcriptional regulator [Frankia sp. ACN1ag]